MERPSKRPKINNDEKQDTGDAGADSGMQNFYLETVDRSKLDFDQEKLCSVSLSNLNVYSCLVCGKFFAGRSKSTPAFFHSLESGHHVYMNLSSLQVYILPDLYENTNTALDDIKYACDPTYSKDEVDKLDKIPTTKFALDKTQYRPGVIGLNNRKGFDHIGATLHALSHVSPLRNYFLLENFDGKSEMIRSFSLLLRKIWSSRLLRAHVSPDEFLRQVSASNATRKDFSKEESEPQEFMSHLINTLHMALNGSTLKSRSKKPSIVSALFQGQVQIETQKVYAVSDSQANGRTRFQEGLDIDTKLTPFLFLGLDLPPTPLFQDEVQGNIIPQVALTELLNKYNGNDVEELAGQRKRYCLTKLPPFLIFYIKRFTKNDFKKDKNPTIVNFPLRSLDMKPYSAASETSTIYDLTSNITHELVVSSTGTENHVFRTQVKDQASDLWYQLEGLYVQEIKKDLISIGASLIQIWQQRRPA